MEAIFFEKQDGQLCAQHALNALLQGPYFTAPDLAEIAQNLDLQERNCYSGSTSDRFSDQESNKFNSQNMDDSGYFSIQVISQALKIWNLELVPFTSASSDEAAIARADPASQSAYICHFRQHWFAVRKFAGKWWFNLNSLLSTPELISETYLSLFLTQLQSEGYSIFVVIGELSHCPADDVFLDDSLALKYNRRSDHNTSPPVNSSTNVKIANADDQVPTNDEDSYNEFDLELKEALIRSKADLDSQDTSLQRALTQSLLEAGASSSTANTSSSVGGHRASDGREFDDNEDADLRLAIQLSLADEPASASQSQQMPVVTVTNHLSAEQLRQKRLEYLEKAGKATVNE